MSKRRRRHWIRWTLLSFFLLVLLTGIAGFLVVNRAYEQVRDIARPLDGIGTTLAKARTALSRGKLPNGDPFSEAARITREAERQIGETDWAYRFVEGLPVLKRPMEAVELQVAAAKEWTAAAVVMRDIVTDLLGPKALRASAKTQGTPGQAPVFHDGVVDIELVRSLPPRIEQVIEHLESAERSIRRIRDVPFYPRLGAIKERALAESAKQKALARDALSTAKLLPSFLGAGEPKRYFFAMANGADLRATGGAVLGYAFVVADRGKLTLVEGGRVHELDDKFGGVYVKLPKPVAWYMKLAHVAPRLANGANYSPNLPLVGQAWAAMVRKITGKPIDGAIVVDTVAVAHYMGERSFEIPVWPVPITGENLVSLVGYDQYSLEKAQAKQMPGQIVHNSWALIRDPAPFMKSMHALARMLREKHIQVWSADPQQAALLSRLGWSGELNQGPGDYFFLVDNKRVANKVDYFSSQEMTYEVELTPKGEANSTFQVELTNATPPNQNYHVKGSHLEPYALNRAMMSLYVPERTRFESVDPNHSLFDYEPPGFVEQVQEGFRIFIQTIDAWPGHPGVLTLGYTVPNVVERMPDGRRVYRLTVQHQPLINDAQLTVKVTLPKGATVSSAPGWKIDGRVATLQRTLTRDFVAEIYF